jgi:ubiquinone/menaquinone biosynthesis C-methylase UbiE
MEQGEYDVMRRIEDGHWWYVGLRALLAQFMAEHVTAERPHILDVGCGTGGTLSAFAGKAEAVGIDLASDAIRYCRDRGHSRTVQASALHLPLPSSQFDAAVCLDVLYHKAVPDKQAPLREMHRVLKPGGLVFINVPAYQWLYSSHDVHIHTDKRFTRGEMKRLLHDCGFEPLRVTYWNFFLFAPAALTRLWRRVSPPKGSDLTVKPGALSSRLFGTVLKVECRMLRHMSLPFGLSVFAVARRRHPEPAGDRQ